MILADFTDIQRNRDNNASKKSITHVHTSQANEISQYSGNKVSRNKNKQQHTIDFYIDELGIGGVKEQYSREEQQKQKKLNKTIHSLRQQQQNKSIQRLYTTGLSSKTFEKNINKLQNANNQHGSQHDSQKQDQESYHQQPKHYYNQLYHQEKQFDHQFRVKKLSNQCQQLYKKLWTKFNTKYQILVADNQQDKRIKQLQQLSMKSNNLNAKKTVIILSTLQDMFVKSIIGFLLQYSLTTTHNSQFINSQDQLFIQYSDFINKKKRKEWTQTNKEKQLDQSFRLDHLKIIAENLPFVYFFLNLQALGKVQHGLINTLKDLEKWVKLQLKTQRQWEVIYQVFEQSIQPIFTVPYQTKLYQVKKPSQITKQIDSDDELYNRKPFKANPIPKSTYQKPQQRPASQKKPVTQQILFSFTQADSTNPKIIPQNLYSWDRNFKAKPVPKTVYQPQIIGINQKDKQQLQKKHKEKLYDGAKFPKTMEYLENLTEFQQQRKKELAEKYLRNRGEQKAKVKPVPNFSRIHKKQMHQLEVRKEMNRTNTQPKSFNFTEARKPDMRNTLQNTFSIEYEAQPHPKQRKKQVSKEDFIIPLAKTTAKFDAYVALRKEQKQDKKKQQREKQQNKKRQEEDKRKYKEILKQRMHNQLLNKPKPIQYNNNNATCNLVKVDLQQIYLERPLLMQGTKGKNGGKKNDEERTCFTDSYEPII